MGYKKFNKYIGEKYWVDYFNKSIDFYNTIRKHIQESIPKEDTVGLDIGSGPGVGAKLIADLKFETKLTGFEPSQTSLEGIKLSDYFASEKIPVVYIARRGGILDIETPKPNSYDYILILRAVHEIADSLGGYKKLFNELHRITKGLKKGGVFIVAEPQYSKDNTSELIIKKVQEYQKDNIGHCHVPSDYINTFEMKKQANSLGLKLVKETIVPNNRLLNELNKKGLTISESPCSFYVQTYKLL
jgi:SAM-dependent methyltransferase